METSKETKETKEILMQPNNLIKSRYDFTSVQNKLFYKILFNSQKQKEGDRVVETVVTAEELKQFIRNPNDYVSTSIKETLNMFQQSILEFEYIEEGTGKKLLFSSGLVNSYTYDEVNQRYKIEIHEIIYKHITDFVKMQTLGNGYTPLNLALLFNFKGAYTQRLYTLFRLWSRQNEEKIIKYTVKQLRDYLKIESNKYPQYGSFKQKVLNKAIDEINDSGNMSVKIKEEKKLGRSVNDVYFSVIDYEPRKYFDNALSIKGEVAPGLLESDESVIAPEIVNEEPVIIIEEEDNQNKIDELNNINGNGELDTNNTDTKEHFEKSVQNKKEETKNITLEGETKIPEETILSKGSQRLFKIDFKGHDFTEGEKYMAFVESEALAMDQDNVDEIGPQTYRYFKQCLQNKLQLLNNRNKNSSSGDKKQIGGIDIDEFEKKMLGN